MHRIYLVIIVWLNCMQGHCAIINDLKCYECTSTSASSPCIIEKGNISECNKKYCTIYRRELLDPVGYLINFYRSCEDKPIYLNAIIQTQQHKIYYRSCTTNLCNDGDGIDVTSNNINNENSSWPNVAVVPGMGSLASGLLASRIIVILTFLIV